MFCLPTAYVLVEKQKRIFFKYALIRGPDKSYFFGNIPISNIFDTINATILMISDVYLIIYIMLNRFSAFTNKSQRKYALYIIIFKCLV